MTTSNTADSEVKDEKKPGMQLTARHPSFAEALRFWLKLGFISFGGPAGQIAIMHQAAFLIFGGAYAVLAPANK
jgi:hypothetical protein